MKCFKRSVISHWSYYSNHLITTLCSDEPTVSPPPLLLLHLFTFTCHKQLSGLHIAPRWLGWFLKTEDAKTLIITWATTLKPRSSGWTASRFRSLVKSAQQLHVSKRLGCSMLRPLLMTSTGWSHCLRKNNDCMNPIHLCRHLFTHFKSGSWDRTIYSSRPDWHIIFHLDGSDWPTAACPLHWTGNHH